MQIMDECIKKIIILIICFTYFLFIAENNVRKTSIYNPSQINSSLPRRVEEQPPLEHGDRQRKKKQCVPVLNIQWESEGVGRVRKSGFLKRSA